MADVEGQSLPAESSVHREPDNKARGDELENVFCDGDVDGTENAAVVADTVTERTTSLTSTGVERHSSSSSCDMAPPPHVRRRTRSGGLIHDLIVSVEEESMEKGREYYEEEMEWVQQPEHPHVKKRLPHGDKKQHHGVADKITKIYNAVEDSSKQKGLEYFEEENSWPIQ